MNNISNNINIPGLAGLFNMGNTCYLNAIIQPLNHTIPFANYIRSNKFSKQLRFNVLSNIYETIAKKDELVITNIQNCISSNEYKLKYEGSLIYSINKLFDAMWRENCKITPRSLKTKIGEYNIAFAGNDQQDSQEVLNLILDSIHEETKIKVNIEYNDIPENITNFINTYNYNKNIIDSTICEIQKNKYIDIQSKLVLNNIDMLTFYKACDFWKKYISKNYSIITELFTGLFYSKIICDKCRNMSESFEPFLMLNVETEGCNTLEDCLKNFSKEENLMDLYKCTTCNEHVSAKKKMHIWEPPEILIIQLKRFKNEEVKIPVYNQYPSNIGYQTKFVQSKIHSIIDFPMTNLQLTDNYHSVNKKNNHSYDLYAVTDHTGNCGGGHYSSYCKNKINNTWYKFDDEHVYEIPSENIKSELVSEKAYILYYIRS